MAGTHPYSVIALVESTGANVQTLEEGVNILEMLVNTY